jgi:hypothetical protein
LAGEHSRGMRIKVAGVSGPVHFQWLARPDARSLLLLFTQGSRRRLFINQPFFDGLRQDGRRAAIKRSSTDDRFVVLGQPANVTPSKPIWTNQVNALHRVCVGQPKWIAALRGFGRSPFARFPRRSTQWLTGQRHPPPILTPKKILEPIGRELRITYRVLDVAMHACSPGYRFRRWPALSHCGGRGSHLFSPNPH